MDGEATIPHLHFFPSRLPDESLHSRVSRLHTLSGNLDDRHTLQDAFGSHTLVATSHLPSHLDALVSRLPEDVGASAEDFLEQATLFPYFRPFLRPAQVEQCRAAMCSNNAGDVKIAIGLVASRIGGRNAFRFCRQCCIEDAQRYGVAYWHRAHQLPGVLLCLDHRMPLVEVHANWLRLHRHDLFLPMAEQFSGCLSAHSIHASHYACLTKCARLSVELLRSNQPPLNPGLLRSFYRNCAAQQGWIDVNGRICTSAVCRSASEFSAQWPIDETFRFVSDPHWVFKLLHKHRSSMHPLKHVAMLVLLGSDWSSLRHYCESRHVPSKPIAPQRPRTCSPPDVTPSIASATRPKTLKGEKLQKLKIALATKNTLQEIAQAHGVSIPSLYRILHRYPIVEAERSECYRNAHRQRFVDELASTPPRRAHDYMWLYRNDRAWLEQRIAERLPRTGKGSAWRVDWKTRDGILEQTVRNLAMAFRAAVPPIRVSKTLIARSTGKQATIEKYASRLPLTMAALAEAAESVEHFQCRRLEWACRELADSGEPLLPWQIVRIAGLELPLAPALERFLSQITGDYGINADPAPWWVVSVPPAVADDT